MDQLLVRQGSISTQSIPPMGDATLGKHFENIVGFYIVMCNDCFYILT